MSIDIKAPATYDLRLGESLTKPAGSKRYSSIRYNHRPSLQRAEGTTRRIIKNSANTASELLLEDGTDTYTYAGRSEEAEESYVLILREGADDRSAMLEKLSRDWVFNLTATSSEPDVEVLKKRHPQLSHDETDQSDILGSQEADKEVPIDPDNPFDYRHYLKLVAEPKGKPAEAETPRSALGTPAHTRTASGTPLARPAKRATDSALVPQRKRKAQPQKPETASSKRIETAEPSQPGFSQKKPRKPQLNETPPKARPDCEPLARELPSSDGELVLENDSKPAPSKKAMSLALTGQLGPSGPRSLHSAASTPASHALQSANEPDNASELGRKGSSSPELTQSYGFDFKSDDEDADADADADADVEDLELPAPAAVQRVSVGSATVTTAALPEEDDLDAQLAAAMAEEDGAPVSLGVAQEEEEESEEE
ncbi:hypothetical protein LTR62_002701 [Meristemomyces frigidus]|uniref:Transcription elongation factor Eaf N-terminal domain-containing protein n=1 Tax=Meristemomyces frigidus TaxID=1508187 RepID=A0AAN7YHB4_9PEZI|nr:hypothetical protein LTR62_002701 [Meristemomyces frigidus]